ncbi:thiol reductant ABC exporter subunit CydC [Methylocella tundrae]|uniref:thiol reductant ABC exporter subunit CydC n=1 Tax=Methylocella tundrae TaxID=227605 RepID=UPI002ADEC370|nr:thiol reductant ABC exporter subunit CydC [Methylocella tundrae]WPP03025.1 thiol reductant ABC exporter subunit CydC [Methylocella tundrae]
MNDLIRLLRLYRPYAGWIALSIAASLAATLANIGLMAASGWFITAMALAGVVAQSFNYFTPAAVIRAFAILRTGGRYLDRLISHEATFRLLATSRGWLFAHLEPLAPGALSDFRSGDLMARLKGDVDRLELVFLRLLAPLAVAALSSIVVILTLARHDGRLAAAVGAALLVAGLILPFVAAFAGRGAGRRTAEISAEIRTSIVDDLDGLALLQLTGADRRRFDALDRRYGDLIAEEARLARSTGFGQSGVALAGDLAAGAALLIGIPLVSSGRMSGPDLTMATLLALAAFEAFNGVPAAFTGLAGTLASARRIFALVDRQPIVVDPAKPQNPPARFDLEFTRVGLTYPGASRPALADIDLCIPEGARVAIVGSSGAGKSSLVDLLVRFRNPTSGQIRLGGAPIDQLSGEAVRERIAVVPQNAHLFTATIADNLRLARPGASDAELRDAAAAACLLSSIEALPQGFDTPVGIAGARLSGGEARRLAIARALLAASPILVLDEPSEGLDAETENDLFDALLARNVGRTLILLTHRFSAIERMDEIIVIEAGRIVERGRFDELSERDGAFRRLFDRIDETIGHP